MIEMLGQKPDFTGKIQVKNIEPDKTVYAERGEIALWKHTDSKYILRGYVTIDGTRYLVSLSENGE
jgi:hypothetical protein